ncbi:hypothetical protein B0T26DRAFT_748553 [Lasiosphaeria miniovina]|uniref:Uncharacterized protein n=1 Tax=Lasiosphaeria miniovina TaxID=1954250 RepID=A0AA40B678_9PEZI|nr:uncharacterized protein B0T26DRAFT_748553 [Lasiosphaeria miniovina]KAK0728319.1 hypothetical protein B0T26DRAFT_748553 [Lasiosphaeria miniovina]
MAFRKLPMLTKNAISATALPRENSAREAAAVSLKAGSFYPTAIHLLDRAPPDPEASHQIEPSFENTVITVALNHNMTLWLLCYYDQELCNPQDSPVPKRPVPAPFFRGEDRLRIDRMCYVVLVDAIGADLSKTAERFYPAIIESRVLLDVGVLFVEHAQMDSWQAERTYGTSRAGSHLLDRTQAPPNYRDDGHQVPLDDGME